MSLDLRSAFERLSARRDLSASQAHEVFQQVMTGALAADEIRTLLVLLAQKGECVAELVGAARAMRQSAVKIKCDSDCVDTCGTGGDGVSTFNVSTTAAIIAASAGAIVAKHGNTSTTRKSGSTEVMRELGVNTDASKETVEKCLRDIGIGYLNARLLHPAMRHAAPVRRALPLRTIFNLLGPLTNPAGAQRQLLGVSKPEHVDLLAAALMQLGVRHAWVIHGNGLCDVTVTGPTIVAEIKDDVLTRKTIQPEDVDLPAAPVESLLVQSPRDSADAIRAILGGVTGSKRNHAMLNAAAALIVAGIARDLRDGITRAAAAVDSGAAREKLEAWCRLAKNT